MAKWAFRWDQLDHLEMKKFCELSLWILDPTTLSTHQYLNDVGELAKEFQVVVVETEKSQKVLQGLGLKKVSNING